MIWSCHNWSHLRGRHRQLEALNVQKAPCFVEVLPTVFWPPAERQRRVLQPFVLDLLL